MKRIILSGGGTGGHIYPAIAVAEALKRVMGEENVEILFVGAEGKMEMTVVPKAGYRIIGVPIAGLQRTLSLKNLLLPFKVIKSVWEAKRILKGFKPDVVVGFGGYASAPVLWAAQRMGIPTVIQEQNSYAEPRVYVWLTTGWSDFSLPSVLLRRVIRCVHHSLLVL